MDVGDALQAPFLTEELLAADSFQEKENYSSFECMPIVRFPMLKKKAAQQSTYG